MTVQGQKFVAVIPAYNPGSEVRSVVAGTAALVDEVILVDDGSDEENRTRLEQCAAGENVRLLRFPVNQGKGHALIEGLKEALAAHADFVVTIDSDGQHDPAEIRKFTDYLAATDRKADLIIGARQAVSEMPLRSRVGNVFTARLFNSLFGKAVTDTQSGFRVLSADFAREVIGKVLPGRYETEMRMLILAAASQRTIEDIRIRTIYLDDNRNSKFRPLRDSLRVLLPLSKYTGVAFASFLVDYAVFLTLAYLLGVYYLLAHAIARVCSGTFNFLSNKHLVFKSRSRKLPEALRYLAAVAFSLAVTALLLYCLVDLLGVSKALAKPAAEFTMFLANFIVLHRFVFRK